MSTELAKHETPAVVDGVLRFTVLIEGRVNQVFELSSEVLLAHFGAASTSDEDLLEAFRRGKSEILAVAAQSANTPVNGMIQLGAGDFSESPPDAQTGRE